MVVRNFSETLVSVLVSTRHNIPEALNLHQNTVRTTDLVIHIHEESTSTTYMKRVQVQHT